MYLQPRKKMAEATILTHRWPLRWGLLVQMAIIWWLHTKLDLQIIDARPFWEKRYYEGHVTLVPLENLKPSPLAHLENVIRMKSEELPDPPCKATLTLQSFRLVSQNTRLFQSINLYLYSALLYINNYTHTNIYIIIIIYAIYIARS